MPHVAALFCPLLSFLVRFHPPMKAARSSFLRTGRKHHVSGLCAGFSCPETLRHIKGLAPFSGKRLVSPFTKNGQRLLNATHGACSFLRGKAAEKISLYLFRVKTKTCLFLSNFPTSRRKRRLFPGHAENYLRPARPAFSAKN